MTRALALFLMLTAAACRQAPAPTSDTNLSADNVVIEETDAAAVENEALPPLVGEATAPEPAPIPAKFRGTWAESKTACTELNHPSRLTISGRTVRTPGAVLFGDSFAFATPNQFALEGRFEGSDRAGAAHYSLDATGNILTDEAGGGAVRVRCA